MGDDAQPWRKQIDERMEFVKQTADKLKAHGDDPGLPLTTGEGNTADDPFNDAALLRLAASNEDYYRAHGHYVPPLALRLHATRAERDRLREQLDAARQALADVMPWLVVPSDVPEQHWETLGRVRDAARAALGVEGPPGYFIPEGDERCGFTMDACQCMKRKGHDGLHGCAHGGWRSDPAAVREQEA